MYKRFRKKFDKIWNSNERLSFRFVYFYCIKRSETTRNESIELKKNEFT